MKKINIVGTDEKIYEHTCKNGLKIYIWEYNLSEEVVLSLTVKYGSIHTHFNYDGKDITVPDGMAHFLEHIKFNEEKNQTAHDYFIKWAVIQMLIQLMIIHHMKLFVTKTLKII